MVISGGIQTPADVNELSPYMDATGLGTIFERGAALEYFEEFWSAVE